MSTIHRLYQGVCCGHYNTAMQTNKIVQSSCSTKKVSKVDTFLYFPIYCEVTSVYVHVFIAAVAEETISNLKCNVVASKYTAEENY